LARVGPDAAPHDGDVIEDRPWSRRVDYWYTFFVSHPCPMTVRSELNHESLNTTHSPSLMRVVVEQPASAMIATTSRVFILAPSPCLDVPRASGALPRQWTSLYHQARGVPSGNAGPVTSFHGSPASSGTGNDSFRTTESETGANERRVRMFPLPTSVIPLIFGTINFRNNTNNTEDPSLLSPGSGVRAGVERRWSRATPRGREGVDRRPWFGGGD